MVPPRDFEQITINFEEGKVKAPRKPPTETCRKKTEASHTSSIASTPRKKAFKQDFEATESEPQMKVPTPISKRSIGQDGPVQNRPLDTQVRRILKPVRKKQSENSICFGFIDS